MNDIELSRADLQDYAAIVGRIIEGLIILAKYYPDAVTGEIIADGEQVWYGKYEPDRMERQDLQRLEEMSWFEELGKWTIEVIPCNRSPKTPVSGATITGKLNPPQVRPPLMLEF